MVKTSAKRELNARSRTAVRCTSRLPIPRPSFTSTVIREGRLPPSSYLGLVVLGKRHCATSSTRCFGIQNHTIFTCIGRTEVSLFFFFSGSEGLGIWFSERRTSNVKRRFPFHLHRLELDSHSWTGRRTSCLNEPRGKYSCNCVAV